MIRLHRWRNDRRNFSSATTQIDDGEQVVTKPKKDLARLEAIRRRQWHLRQNKDKESREGVNKGFRKIQIPDKTLSFIRNHGLGRYRVDRFKAAKEQQTDEKKPLQIYDKLFKYKEVKFLGSARVPESIPAATLPEVAFLGRSNVGKSSLINALMDRHKAKVSAKPGYTRSINFFQLQGTLRLVDLPGYGFALIKNELRSSWHQLVKDYLTQRDVLKRTCLLVDSRVGLKQSDRDMISFFEANKVKYQIIMTKADLVGQLDLARRYTILDQELKPNRYYIEPIIPCSSKNFSGISLLRAHLAALAKRRPTSDGTERGAEDQAETEAVPSATQQPASKALRAPKPEPLPLKQRTRIQPSKPKAPSSSKKKMKGSSSKKTK